MISTGYGLWEVWHCRRTEVVFYWRRWMQGNSTPRWKYRYIHVSRVYIPAALWYWLKTISISDMGIRFFVWVVARVCASARVRACMYASARNPLCVSVCAGVMGFLQCASFGVNECTLSKAIFITCSPQTNIPAGRDLWHYFTSSSTQSEMLTITWITSYLKLFNISEASLHASISPLMTQFNYI